jgi:hypothetical protein
LLVDEAHRISVEVLEELRMMTNLVCAGRTRLHLAIAGCQEIEESVARLESFNQRIGVRCYLSPMNRTETMLFALAQIQKFGREGREVFQPTALEKLYEITNGVPRIVCQLCDAALQLAADQGEPRVSRRMMEIAWSELQQLPAHLNSLVAQPAAPEKSGIVEFGALSDDPGVSRLAMGNQPASILVPDEDDDLPIDRLIDDFGPPMDFDSDVDFDFDSDGELDETGWPIHEIEADAGCDEAVDTRLNHLLKQLSEIDNEHAGQSGMANDRGDSKVADRRSRPSETTDPADLFGAFDEEESVSEAHAWRAAAQNQTASKLKPAQLGSLTPSEKASSGKKKPAKKPVRDEIVLDEPLAAASPAADDAENESRRTPRSNKRKPSATAGSPPSDDRDMLIRSSGPESRTVGDERPAKRKGAGGPPMSTGQALRVDYQDLFRQLRESGPDAIS